MGSIFTGIYNIVQRNSKTSIGFLLLFIALTLISISRLHFVEDITRIVPNDKKEVGQMNMVFSHARLMEKVVFTVHTKDSVENTQLLADFAHQFSDSLATKLQPRFISELQAKIPQKNMLRIYSVFNQHLPIFLTESDYTILDSLLSKDQIEKAIKADFRTLMSPADFGLKSYIKNDPLSLTRLALAKLERFRPSDDFKLIHDFIFTSDKQNLVFFLSLAHPKESNITIAFEAEMQDIANQLLTLPKYHNIGFECFGAPLVAAANAQQIKKDIQLTVSIAVVFLLIIISLFFKSKRAVFIIFTPAVLGALVSLAIITLIKSEVSLISLGIGAVLLGISVDFALHIYAHYREHASIKSIYHDLSLPILISSLTTAAAFASLTLLKSEVMGDLGIFLAISVVSSALFSLLLFPHLLKKNIKKTTQVHANWIDALSRIDLSKSKVLVYSIIIITLFFLFSDNSVYFDQDLYKSNFMTPQLRNAEAKINHITGADRFRSVYVASISNQLERALEKNEELTPEYNQVTKQHIAAQYVNIAKIVPSLKTQKERIKRWENYWTQERCELVKSNIIEASKKYGFTETAFQSFYYFINSDSIPLLPYDKNPLYHQFARDYVVNLDSGFAVISQIDVKKNSGNRQKIAELFEGSSALVMDKLSYTQKIINGLKTGFDNLVFISLGLVFLILLVSFGRIELAIISFLPVSVSWLWIVGVMDLLGLQFNIFNVIILSFVFGLGIDYSIFYMRALILNHTYGGHEQKTYRASILLSVITSIIGIGVLIFSKHPAMRSIALMSVIGILTIILITFTLIPISFRWLVSYKKGKRQKVVTALDTFTSIIFFLTYVSGSITMTLLIPVFMIFPASKRKKRDVYRYFIKIFSSYIFLHPTIPIKIINDNKERFEKPAMIIANHQSVIDIMLMLLLSNKVLIVTNERVWKHWLWGAVLRYAEYYPAFAGYDNMHEKLQEKVNDGYSIMIFPEGSRSLDNHIKRFHKGAFYLAESLGLDMLPILLHGVNETLRKGEFFLFSGKITMKILPRINLKTGEMGTGMRDQAKGMTAYFRKEYEELRKEVAGVDYYALQLQRNFVYKGPVLEWYFKVKLRMEDRYRLFDSLIPRDAVVYDLGCGYGFLSLMLGMISPQRKIIGVDFDAEKIALAQNSAIRSQNLMFFHDDVTSYPIEKADVFLILDTLHYFSEEKQKALINRCMMNLNLGGKLIIRDANKDIEEKHRSTVFTERWSTGIGFNKANFSDLHFISEQLIRNVVQEASMKIRIAGESKHLSNRIYIITHD
jgi:1-acyl-sn-glycerol-3-phosphate acyltransferase